jgi:hypothetical protein
VLSNEDFSNFSNWEELEKAIVIVVPSSNSEMTQSTDVIEVELSTDSQNVKKHVLHENPTTDVIAVDLSTESLNVNKHVLPENPTTDVIQVNSSTDSINVNKVK